MTHIALVEDDPGCQAQITDYLERYSQESGEQFKLCVFGDGDNILSSYRAQYDVILMDIQMKFVDGMTAAREIRERDDQVLIIFITSLAAYAVKGYEADGHSLSYHTADGVLSATGTIKEVESGLEGGWFFRCGKGLLVNLEHVDGVTDGDAVVHGTTVQVSRSRRKDFLAALNRYINEVGQ